MSQLTPLVVALTVALRRASARRAISEPPIISTGTSDVPTAIKPRERIAAVNAEVSP